MSASNQATPSHILTRLKAILNNNAIFTPLVVIVFFLLGAIGIANHEMWSDELQAWMIARDSNSIIDLFKNLRYEGHPGLWHFCLYILSRMSHNPVLMQIFHLIIATSSVFLFARFSPFKPLQKTLFIFSYFSFYEYAIISRSYALGVFLIFTFCTIYLLDRQKNKITLSIILALLANTSAYGLVIATSLQCLLITEIYLDKDHRPIREQRALLISLIIFSVAIGVAVLQMLPPADSGVATVINNELGNTNINSDRARKVLRMISTVWESYIPIPIVLKYEFWNTNLIDTVPQGLKFKFFSSLLLLLFSTQWFTRTRPLLACYLLGVSGLLVINYFKYGNLRHSGHLFILFIAYLWITPAYQASIIRLRSLGVRTSLADKKKARFLAAILTLILSANCISGIYAFSRDLVNPFSASRKTANFIRSNSLNHLFMVGSVDADVINLAGLLERQIYYLESAKLGSFITGVRRNVELQEVLPKAREFLTDDNAKILLVSNRNLADYDSDPQMLVQHLASFEESIVSEERFHLYLLQKADK
jgi:hypothetical protein